MDINLLAIIKHAQRFDPPFDEEEYYARSAASAEAFARLRRGLSACWTFVRARRDAKVSATGTLHPV